MGAVSKQVRYAAAGGLLSAGAPLGLLLVRLLSGQAGPGLLDDWAALPAIYSYVTISTATVFTAFGAALGRKADGLVQLATEDPLTRLLNRRAMEERLERELQRTARYGEPLSVLLIDVDHLKQVNDLYGHASGDRALRRVAGAVRERCRTTDVAGRWGGDEFLLAGPSTDTEPARHLAERLREDVSSPAETPRLSVSIGVATCRGGHVPSAAVLLAQADEALYRAKQQGRNRVMAGPPSHDAA